MTGKFIFALYVCLALTEYSIGRGIFRRACVEGDVVHDECGRRCQCENGNLVNCCRIRKEFTSMTHEERVRYINTVLKASNDSAFKTEYEDLLLRHKKVFHKGIHSRGKVFLPWHLWYILQYEDLLRRVDCMVTVPYWDWSAVAADPWSSSMWNTGNDGFGGDGDPNANYCVKTGPFRDPVWSYPLMGYKRACLQRIFRLKAEDSTEEQPGLIVAGTEAVDDLMMIQASSISNFEETLRVNLHGIVHDAINGTMCCENAAYAPEFFLHHGFIDKLWWDWQSKGDEYMYHEFFNDQTEQMIDTDYNPREFLNLNKVPGDAGVVCAAYEEKIAMNFVI